MDCDIFFREFELHSQYQVHFQTNKFAKGMNPLYPNNYWLNSIILVLQ